MQYTVDRYAAGANAAPSGHTYAEPLAGLRVSWGAILAGTAAMLAVSLILWGLALAIVSLLTHPVGASLKSAVVALWIVGMATTLIGAYVGGSLAGALPGNPRRGIGAVHGFLAWCVALLLTFGTHVALLRGAVATATGAALDMATSVAPGPGEAGGNEASPGPRFSQAEAARAGQTALAVVVGLGWSWFGTWALSGVLAVAGAAASARRVGVRDADAERERLEMLRERERELEREHERSMRGGPPLTPAPSA